MAQTTTSVLTYTDFTVILKDRTNATFAVTIEQPTGPSLQEILRLPYKEDGLEKALLEVENAILRASKTGHRSNSTEEQTLKKFGQDLFNALFVGAVRDQYYLRLDEALQQEQGLRLRLQIHAPALVRLPWELLYDPQRKEHLSLSPSTPIVRNLPLLDIGGEPLLSKPPLRILGMIASPTDKPPLDVEQERQKIERKLDSERDKRLVELTWVPGETWSDLQKALRDPYHIFHFIGHADFNPHAAEGHITLANEAGTAHDLPAEELGLLLKTSRSVRLVTLNACNGGRSSQEDLFSSIMATLVQAGIPAVIGMHYEITDETAPTFSSTLYEKIAEGLPIEQAVQEARVAIRVEGQAHAAWGLPLLYLQTPSSPIVMQGAPFPVEGDGRTGTNVEPDVPPKPSPNAWYLAAVLSLLLLIFGGGYWYIYEKEHVEYYNTFALRWGLPEGVGRLTEEEVRHRNVALKFIRRGLNGPVEKVLSVNNRWDCPFLNNLFPAVGGLNPLSNETVESGMGNYKINETVATCRIEFVRDASGRILKQNVYNRNDRLLYALFYRGDDIAEYTDGPFTSIRRDIRYLKFLRQEEGPQAGLVQEIHFLDDNQQPQADHNGLFGTRYIHDEHGLAVEIINLGVKETTEGVRYEPMDTKAGLRSRRIIFDERGNVSRIVHLNAEGQPMAHEDWTPIQERAYDAFGNLTKIRFLDQKEQPIIHPQTKVAGVAMGHDRDGNITTLKLLDRQGQLVTGTEGGGLTYAKAVLEYKSNGYQTLTNFGPDDRPIYQNALGFF